MRVCVRARVSSESRAVLACCAPSHQFLQIPCEWYGPIIVHHAQERDYLNHIGEAKQKTKKKKKKKKKNRVEGAGGIVTVASEYNELLRLWRLHAC